MNPLCVRCPHYYRASRFPRKCYYDPQCWIGDLGDLGVLILFPIAFFGFKRRKRGENMPRRRKEETELSVQQDHRRDA